MKLSYSRLSTYLECPTKFRRQYLGAARLNDTSDALDIGKAFHWAIETHVQELKEKGVDGDVKLDRNRLRELYMQVDLSETGPMDMGAFQDGLNIINNLDLTINIGRVLEVEGGFDEPITGTEHEIIGFIDRVDQLDDETLEVVDYKTGKNPVFAEENKQLKIYAWALHRRMPHIKRFILRIENVRLNETSVWEFPAERIAEVDAWLTYIASRLQRELDAWSAHQEDPENNPKVFTPKFGIGCSWCSHAQSCIEEFPYGEPQIKSGRDIDDMVRDFVRLQAMGKRAYRSMFILLDKISAASNHSDATEFTNEFGTYRLDADLSFTLSDVKDVFQKYDKKISPFLKLEEWKLKKEVEKGTPFGRALFDVSRPKTAIVKVEQEE